jgi:hypothetical protein
MDQEEVSEGVEEEVSEGPEEEEEEALGMGSSPPVGLCSRRLPLGG